MSFLTSVRASTRRVVQSSRLLPPTSSAFHISAVQRTLKESDQNRDDLPDHYEAQKEDQLKSTKEGKAKWKAELASNSEADIKADRGEIDSDDKTFEAMQAKTKNLPNRKGPVNKTQ